MEVIKGVMQKNVNIVSYFNICQVLIHNFFKMENWIIEALMVNLVLSQNQHVQWRAIQTALLAVYEVN